MLEGQLSKASLYMGYIYEIYMKYMYEVYTYMQQEMFIYEVYMVGHHILRGIYINIESIYTCVYEVYMYEVYMYTYI